MPGGQPAGWQQPAPGDNPRVNAPVNQNPYGQVGGMPQAPPDAWLQGPASGQPLFPGNQPQQQPVEVPRIPLEVALNARDAGQFSAANPITAAAAPLLILLGRLRLMIVDMQAVPLMQHVANEIHAFERRVVENGVDPQEARIATYVLCATADDIVQNLPGTDRHVWLQYSMVAQFFQVRNAGVGFYEELAKVLHNPAPRYDLLELMHACLSLGFEGQYRGTANGQNELQRIRRDVYQTLRHLKSRGDEDISPRWRGLDLRMSALTSRVPLWAIASAAAAVLLACFFVLRILLGNNVDILADDLVALHPSAQVALQRAAFAPAVVPDTRDQTQLERIREAIGADIDGCLNAESVGQEIVISVCNVLLFDSGQAVVKPEFQDLATRIANSLQNEPGPIQIIGHTDNVKPSGTGRFKSNFDLSVARAQAVKDVMAPFISDQSRFQVEGRGDLDPIADNSTEEGRAQNRRVEIMIPREDTLQNPTPGA
jgi:type VI secretion system protein ImpK